MRRIECLKYAECLRAAAVENKREWGCGDCKDYEWHDPTEEEETVNTKIKGEEAMAEKKICTKCGKEKNIEDFNKGVGKGGRKSRCRQCEADYYQEYKVRKAEGKVKPYKSALRKRVIRNAKKAVEKKREELGTQHGQAELVRATGEKPDKIREVPALRRAVDLLIRCGCLSEAKLKAAMELAGE